MRRGCFVFCCFLGARHFWQVTDEAVPERLPQERIRFTDGVSEGAAVSSSGGSDELTGEPRERRMKLTATRTERGHCSVSRLHRKRAVTLNATAPSLSHFHVLFDLVYNRLEVLK